MSETTRRSRRAWLLILWLGPVSCGGSSAGQAAPTPVPVPSPPATGPLSIVGNVFSEADNQPLSATVRIVEGPSAGRTASTASNGSFRIDGVPGGRHTLSVISPPFAENRAWIYADPDAKGNAIAFYLFSPGHGSGGTFEGSIRATDPACETVRVFQNHAAKPCQRYGPFPVPVFGNMFIQLNWPLPSPNELDFELWRNGIPATQSGDDINPYDLIRGGINDGSYEVRVVYLGTTSQNYQLRVAFAWN